MSLIDTYSPADIDFPLYAYFFTSISIAVVIIGGTVSIPSLSNGDSLEGLTTSPFNPPKKVTFDISSSVSPSQGSSK